MARKSTGVQPNVAENEAAIMENVGDTGDVTDVGSTVGGDEVHSEPTPGSQLTIVGDNTQSVSVTTFPLMRYVRTPDARRYIVTSDGEAFDIHIRTGDISRTPVFTRRMTGRWETEPEYRGPVRRITSGLSNVLERHFVQLLKLGLDNK